jgi:hypothetical protein
LAPLLTIAVVAKLAGQSRLEPLADWARQRAPELARAFGLKRLSMPHQTTWSPLLAKAVDVNALEGVLARFFQAMQRQATVPG